jgi:hypothetical protein
MWTCKYLIVRGKELASAILVKAVKNLIAYEPTFELVLLVLIHVDV